MRQEKYQHLDTIREKQKDNKKTLKGHGKGLREEFLADTLRIPMDVCMGESRVTMTGCNRVWIENYRGILEYTDSCILIQSKGCQIRVEGKKLCMEYYTCSDLLVRGIISGVQFVR